MKNYSAFDYTITITRRFTPRGRYLVVGTPEFNLQVAAIALDFNQQGQAASQAIGSAVVQVLSKIQTQLQECDRTGQSPPKPLRARGYFSRTLFPSGEAARALGVSP